ncbi:MAG TPA: polysaccharide deacetylase family protein [Nitriliruptorales bacterium]
MRPDPSRRGVALLAVVATLAGACADSTGADQIVEPSPTAVAPAPSPAPSTQPSPSPDNSDVATVTDHELGALGVNELGRIPVIEWHKIQDADGRWENSLATFRAQLQELCDRNYRPISIDEFIDATFDVPAGSSPVLLTFDDSYKEHFFFADDGVTPHPDSAVGILQAMEQTCGGWRARASFAFYWPVPFRETDRALIERKLNYLVDNGFDLSNHTYNHDNLRDMTDAQVIESVGRHETELAAVIGHDYRVRSITLTQGIWPVNADLALTGTYEGFTYHHEIAFEVGFMPTRSPHHLEYDPHSVQRVQAWVDEFDKWIAWLDENPTRRFVSDGDPTTVTYPADWADVAEPRPGLEVRTYPVSGSADEAAPS